ncbi:hypothetical protein PYH66_09870 [Staphylococcus delphini]|uniref:hypothetical protein n=1 Tax=Staphylococcus delphini TaxID=53344 RepID=UPI003364EE98
MSTSHRDLSNVKRAKYKYNSYLERRGDGGMNTLVNLSERIIQLEKERDELITDAANLRNQRDKLQCKLDDVVDMVNAYITAKKAYSGGSTYNLLENELNRILDGDLMSKQNKFKRLYSTEIEQVLKHKNLAACLFLLEKIQMDLEEDE